MYVCMYVCVYVYVYDTFFHRTYFNFAKVLENFWYIISSLFYSETTDYRFLSTRLS
jgi:hypothetical protein